MQARGRWCCRNADRSATKNLSRAFTPDSVGHLPGPLHVADPRAAVHAAGPAGAEVVRQAALPPKGQHVTPAQGVPVRQVVVVAGVGPAAHQDLEHRVVPVHPEEVLCKNSPTIYRVRSMFKAFIISAKTSVAYDLDSSLCVGPGLHAADLALGVVQQLQRPQVVVHLHHVVVAAPEVGHQVVQLVV